MYRKTFLRFLGRNLARKDHITWWMRAADFRPVVRVGGSWAVPKNCDPVGLLQNKFRASEMGFGLPQKIGKKKPRNRKTGSTIGFWGHFQFFSYFFPVLQGRGGQTPSFPFFPISGRRPETYSVASQRDCDPRIIVGCNDYIAYVFWDLQHTFTHCAFVFGASENPYCSSTILFTHWSPFTPLLLMRTHDYSSERKMATPHLKAKYGDALAEGLT